MRMRVGRAARAGFRLHLPDVLRVGFLFLRLFAD